MRVRVTIEIPDIAGELLLKGLGESETVDICPDANFPGWKGRIVRFDHEVPEPDDDHSGARDVGF
jgi:hypothetical protein